MMGMFINPERVELLWYKIFNSFGVVYSFFFFHAFTRMAIHI